MPWTIPNLLLHDKPLPLSEQRALGYTKLFVNCSNPDCHHNAVLDASQMADEITYNDLPASHGLHGVRSSRCGRAHRLPCTLGSAERARFALFGLVSYISGIVPEYRVCPGLKNSMSR